MKIKSCPLCGVELDTISFYAHPTNGCLLQHVYFAFDDEHAIEAWNRRTETNNILQQLEEKANEEIYTITYEQDIYTDGYKDGLRTAIEIMKGGME